MIFKRRLLWSFLVMGILSACVVPQARIDAGLEGEPDYADFDVKARFSLQYTPPASAANRAPQQLSGRLEWAHVAGGDQLLFMDPLGQGVARLERQRDGTVRLEHANGKTEEKAAGQADQLLEAALGVPLALDDLLAWMRARPGPGARIETDATERPIRVRESGWLIFYQYGDTARLPSRVDASLDGVLKLKLAIESWDRPHYGSVKK
jgi:outer membrane lipoprotein LolB